MEEKDQRVTNAFLHLGHCGRSNVLQQTITYQRAQHLPCESKAPPHRAALAEEPGRTGRAGFLLCEQGITGKKREGRSSHRWEERDERLILVVTRLVSM